MTSQLERAKDISQQHSNKLAELYEALLYMVKHHSERNYYGEPYGPPVLLLGNFSLKIRVKIRVELRV